MQNTIQFDMADAVARLAKSEYDHKNEHNHKPCCVTTSFPDDPQVTMAYVPFQLDKTTFTPEIALMEGTLFKALNKPFYGRSKCNE